MDTLGSRSLPSRGAWIEIAQVDGNAGCFTVAPLAGSVDRNMIRPRALRLGVVSLPSRGAWIEIRPMAARVQPALSRSPRGERG